MLPLCNTDGYPTPSALRRLSKLSPPNAALDFARVLWNSTQGSLRDTLRSEESALFQDDARLVRFTTGGWSGNEAIIAALKRNSVAWLMTWQLSARGGLHIFRYLPVATTTLS